MQLSNGQTKWTLHYVTSSANRYFNAEQIL